MPLEKPTEWVKLDCPFRQPADKGLAYWATTFNWHIVDSGEPETRCGMPYIDSMHVEGSLIKPGLDVGNKAQQMCEICFRGKPIDKETD